MPSLYDLDLANTKVNTLGFSCVLNSNAYESSKMCTCWNPNTCKSSRIPDPIPLGVSYALSLSIYRSSNVRPNTIRFNYVLSPSTSGFGKLSNSSPLILATC